MRNGRNGRVQACRKYNMPQSKKPAGICLAGFSNKSLTITYFHTGCSTIIGAKSFHGPVRDGKGWDRLAMVIRHDLSTIREEVPARFWVARGVGVVFSNTGKRYITVKVIGTSRTGN